MGSQTCTDLAGTLMGTLTSIELNFVAVLRDVLCYNAPKTVGPVLFGTRSKGAGVDNRSRSLLLTAAGF